MKHIDQEPADGDRPVRSWPEPAPDPTAQTEPASGFRLTSIRLNQVRGAVANRLSHIWLRVREISARQAARLRDAQIGRLIAGKLKQSIRQVRGAAARQTTQLRARLENQALPDDAKLSAGVRPAAIPRETEQEPAGVRAVHMQAPPSDETRQLPRITPERPDFQNDVRNDVRNVEVPVSAPGPSQSDPLPDTLPEAAAALSAVPDAGLSQAASANRSMSRNGSQSMTPAEKTGALSGMRDALEHTVQAYRKRRANDRSIRRNSRERVYRLKGYTTVAKVNRKYASERRQRLLRRILTAIIIILSLILLIQLYNPIKDLSEWYRIIGIDNLSSLTSTGTVNASGQTSGTQPGISGSVTGNPSPAASGTTTKANSSGTTKATTR